MNRASSPSLALLVLIYAAFVSMGLPDGILGAAWPQMRAELGVGLNENWPMLTLATCGGALSSFLSGLVLRRLGIGTVLVLTAFLTASVILGYAVSPTFTGITALAFLLGLGNGAIDAGLNNFVARNLSSGHMSFLHAFWGVGVSLGTLIVSGILALGGTWRGAYLIVGGVQLLLALAFLRRRGSFSGSAVAEPPEAPEPRLQHLPFKATLALPAAWASMATFFLYCGVESGTGLWIASLLHDARGWSMQAAGLMVTLYWGSLTVGRFLIGTVAQRTTPLGIVRVAVLGAVLGTSLIALSSLMAERTVLAGLLTALGLLFTGFSLSPIFPMLVYDTPRAVGHGHALNLTGFQMGCGNLGNTLLPIALGTFMRVYSIEWLGSMLLALALGMVLLLTARERYVQTP